MQALSRHGRGHRLAPRRRPFGSKTLDAMGEPHQAAIDERQLHQTLASDLGRLLILSTSKIYEKHLRHHGQMVLATSLLQGELEHCVCTRALCVHGRGCHCLHGVSILDEPDAMLERLNCLLGHTFEVHAQLRMHMDIRMVLLVVAMWEEEVLDFLVVDLQHLHLQQRSGPLPLQPLRLLEDVAEQPQKQTLFSYRLNLAHDCRCLACTGLAVAKEASVVALKYMSNHSMGHKHVALLLRHVAWARRVHRIHCLINSKLFVLSA
mmetsp:Transcript_128846/g.223452  ORF Transcript_128846/g.223452 Transcript_128846/m.223452 type:complete len:264 (-) Transcript_128846:238-1029(-)